MLCYFLWIIWNDLRSTECYLNKFQLYNFWLFLQFCLLLILTKIWGYLRGYLKLKTFFESKHQTIGFHLLIFSSLSSLYLIKDKHSSDHQLELDYTIDFFCTFLAFIIKLLKKQSTYNSRFFEDLLLKV